MNAGLSGRASHEPFSPVPGIGQNAVDEFAQRTRGNATVLVGATIIHKQLISDDHVAAREHDIGFKPHPLIVEELCHRRCANEDASCQRCASGFMLAGLAGA